MPFKAGYLKIYYPFSRGILWNKSDRVIIPTLDIKVWKRNLKNKKVNVLCPGYLLEAIIGAFSIPTLQNRGIEINKYILPIYYAEALNLFSFFYKKEVGGEKNIFIEYNRLMEAVYAYPSPIFFDNNDEVYFNLLLNYGERFDSKNNKKPRNKDSFWKQILNNLCVDYFVDMNKFDFFKSKEICYKFLAKFSIKSGEKFVLIDNSNIFSTAADGHLINPIFLYPPQIREISENLKRKNINLIVIARDSAPYYGLGVNKVIPPWYLLKSDLVVSLIVNSFGVISSDQNLYLLAALFGVKNVICLEQQQKGWTFDDVKDISIDSENKNWITFDNENVGDIVSMISEEIK